MKLTLAEPSYLKDSINIISDLVTEARFKINSDAMELVAMDPANVAMVVFKLLSSCFTEYDVKEETQIAINLGNLKQVLRRVGSNDMLSLELTEDNKLSIKLKGNTTRTFNLPIIESLFHLAPWGGPHCEQQILTLVIAINSRIFIVS